MPNFARRSHFISANGVEYGEPLDLEGKKGVIAGEIQAWLEKFGVSLTMNWGPRFNWQLEIFYRGWLLSVLLSSWPPGHAGRWAVRLFRCDRLYGRVGRRPNAGDKNYCPKVWPRKAVEDAGRRLRRNGGCSTVSYRGKVATEIAKLLQVRRVETVRGGYQKESERRPLGGLPVRP